MTLRKVALDKTVVIPDIIEKDLTEIKISKIEGVVTVFLTFLEPDSRGLLRPQTESQLLDDTMAAEAFSAWLDRLLS